MPWRVDTFDVWWLRMNKSARLASTLRMMKAENSEETVTQWHEKHFFFFSAFREIRVWVLYGVYGEKKSPQRMRTSLLRVFPVARAMVLVAQRIGWTWGEAKLENCFSYTPVAASRVCVACNGIQEGLFRQHSAVCICGKGEQQKKQKNSTHDKWRLAFDSSSSSGEKNIDSWRRVFMITADARRQKSLAETRNRIKIQICKRNHDQWKCFSHFVYAVGIFPQEFMTKSSTLAVSRLIKLTFCLHLPEFSRQITRINKFRKQTAAFDLHQHPMTHFSIKTTARIYFSIIILLLSIN